MNQPVAHLRRASWRLPLLASLPVWSQGTVPVLPGTAGPGGGLPVHDGVQARTAYAAAHLPRPECLHPGARLCLQEIGALR